jgi:hypothetical protein
MCPSTYQVRYTVSALENSFITGQIAPYLELHHASNMERDGPKEESRGDIIPYPLNP